VGKHNKPWNKSEGIDNPRENGNDECKFKVNEIVKKELWTMHKMREHQTQFVNLHSWKYEEFRTSGLDNSESRGSVS
jgi:hypothetical protein